MPSKTTKENTNTESFIGWAFFLDWSPSMSGATKWNYKKSTDDIFQRRCANIRKRVGRLTNRFISELTTQGRSDGIFMFAFKVLDEVDRAELFDIARRLSICIKRDCFDHLHVHHNDEHSPLGNHWPILCSPVEKEAVVNDSENTTSYLNPDVNFQSANSYLVDVLFNEQRLLKLKAATRDFEQSDQLALIELRNFLGRRYVYALNNVLNTQLYKRKRSTESWLDAVIITIFLSPLIYMLDYYLLNDISSTGILEISRQKVEKSLLISSVFALLINFYRHNIRSWKKIYADTSSAIGFLHRASTFSERSSELYRKYKDSSEFNDISFSETSHYSGFIGSLETIRDEDKAMLDNSLVQYGIALAAIGLVLSVTNWAN